MAMSFRYGSSTWRTGGEATNDTIVKMNAYGRMRYAHVKHHIASDPIASASSYYTFISWVTPDMEAMAEATSPDEIKPEQIQGHIPEPEREPTEGKDHNRIVRMDAWGRLRLAVVGIEDEGGWLSPTKYGVMTFIRWVAEAETAAMEGKGQPRNGGINQVSPDQVKGLKAPTE